MAAAGVWSMWTLNTGWRFIQWRLFRVSRTMFANGYTNLCRSLFSYNVVFTVEGRMLGRVLKVLEVRLIEKILSDIVVIGFTIIDILVGASTVGWWEVIWSRNQRQQQTLYKSFSPFRAAIVPPKP
ncbi:hypothetical protein IW262DRAFT_1477575 [Armillaria fumosa]|nr:hypothetical protein IW262DRAFT_1477575 [Armillaria fumosa]